MKKTASQTWKTRLLHLLPIALVALWIGLSGIGGPYFGRIDEVSTNDLANFLPKNSEATKVNERLSGFRDTSSIPAIIVFYNEDGSELSDSVRSDTSGALKEIQDVEGVNNTISPLIVADDQKAAYAVVPLASDSEFKVVFPKIEQDLKDADLSVSYHIGGPASFGRDLQTAFGAIDVTLLLVALSAVFIILLIVYRSPILPILVLLTSVAALSVAIILVWHLAKWDVIELNGQTQGILFILVIGAATDYSLLYIARLREEYSNFKSKWKASIAALKGSYEPILAAGGTVSVGLLCLLISDLGSNKALAPVGAIGIGFAILGALTFLPALLALVGRAAFWPRQPQYDTTRMETYEQRHRMWARIGGFVQAHPRPIWIITIIALALASLGYTQFKGDGVSQSDLVLGYSEAREAQKVLDEHFPGGSGSPAYVIVSESKIDDAVKALDADNGVASVGAVATNSPSGSKPLGEARDELYNDVYGQIESAREAQLKTIRQNIAQSMQGAPATAVDAAYEVAKAQLPSIATIADSAYPFSDAKAKVVDGDVLLEATLEDPADSQAARDTVVRLRDEVRQIDDSALVGGTSAIQYDTNQAAIHDRTVIIPLILLAITVILAVLLRSLVAPFVLLFTTVLSFAATLGIAALLFNNVLNFPGADPSVELFGFVFLVALGIDYNIFLMTRVREETMKRGVAKGTIKGLVVTGGVITSAGIVLAATFAALGVIPILFLAQLAFIVAFGVLLDTIIVRSLLVPALTLEIGPKMWWPRKVKK